MVEVEFGKEQKLTFKKFRDFIDLSEEGGFLDLPVKENQRQRMEDRDITTRIKPGAQGTYTLLKYLAICIIRFQLSNSTMLWRKLRFVKSMSPPTNN